MKNISTEKKEFEVFLERLKPLMNLVFEGSKRVTSVTACVCLPAFMSLGFAAVIDLSDFNDFSFRYFVFHLLFKCFGAIYYLTAIILFVYIFVAFEAEYKLLNKQNKSLLINLSFLVFGLISAVLLTFVVFFQTDSIFQRFV